MSSTRKLFISLQKAHAQKRAFKSPVVQNRRLDITHTHAADLDGLDHRARHFDLAIGCRTPNT